LTLQEMADTLQVTTTTVKRWLQRGLLRGHPYSDKNECLYEPPNHSQHTTPGAKPELPAPSQVPVSDRSKEVQYEA
jgi:hypothetical protein